MAPPRRRLESESSSDEELPNPWEEMKKRLEPVSPAPSEEPEVIEIADDVTPSKGGSPPFRVIDSIVEEEPAPPAPRPQSPQPGPSGIQQNDVDDDVEERWLSTIDNNVGTLHEDNKDFDELESAIATAVTGFTAFADKFRAMGTLAYDYKEAYRTSRGALKRKREELCSMTTELERERKRSRELLDANEMLTRDLETERLESHDYKEQRDIAEQDLDQV